MGFNSAFKGLTHYIFNRSIPNAQIWKRYIFFRRTVFAPHLVRQKYVLKCVIRLCDTLFIKCGDVVELCTFITVVLRMAP
jgi:hypothetical protein